MRRPSTSILLVTGVATLLSSALAIGGCEFDSGERADDAGADARGREVVGTLDAFAVDTPLETTSAKGLSCAAIREKRRHGAVTALAQRLRAARDGWLGRGGDCGPADAGAFGGGGPSVASKTNNRVAGVDEADRVQHDGRHLFVLSGTKLVVVDAWPAASAKKLATLDLIEDGVPSRFLLAGSKAIVFLRAARSMTSSRCVTPVLSPPAFGNIDACQGSAECTPIDDGTMTRIVTVDLANPAAPRVVRRTDLPGSLLGARLVGNEVTASVVRSIVGPRVPLPYDGEICDRTLEKPRPKEVVAAAFDRAFDLGRAEIDAALDEPLGVTDRGVREEVDCASVWSQTGGRGEALVTISSFDAARTDSNVRSARLLAEPGFLYATPEHVYLASPEGHGAGANRTFVHRFAIGSAKGFPAYEATGAVAGRVHGSSAMSELRGMLALASRSRSDARSHINLSILERRGNALEAVGSLDDVGLDLTLEGVRFLGDRAFVAVSDPKGASLLSVDLAEPLRPRVIGSIPTLTKATYLHRVSDTTLLSVGPHRSLAGLRLELTDIADPSSPRSIAGVDIPSIGGGSSAALDPLAFQYVGEKRLLALPLDLCTNVFEPPTFSGLALFDVGGEGGLGERGRVSLGGETNMDASRCRNFGYAGNRVKRSVFLDDFAYAIADDVLVVQDVRALGTDVARIRLQ